jgi:hypothetical protein
MRFAALSLALFLLLFLPVFVFSFITLTCLLLQLLHRDFDLTQLLLLIFHLLLLQHLKPLLRHATQARLVLEEH